jgi:SAM-dependent methyltransferase
MRIAMDLSEVVDAQAPRHPWETARAQALHRILRTHGVPRCASVLDYGCGDGFAGRMLADALGANRFAGVDSALVTESADIVRDRAQLGDARFELLLLLDVLEHIEDDVGLLSELCRDHVQADGVALIAVPAGPRLFGPHDEALGHVRRYTRRWIVKVARQAQLTPIASGSLFAGLFAVRAAERAVEQLMPRWAERPRGVGRWNGGPLTTRAIEALLLGEARALGWLERRGAPTVGLSAWVLCRRQ